MEASFELSLHVLPLWVVAILFDFFPFFPGALAFGLWRIFSAQQNPPSLPFLMRDSVVRDGFESGFCIFGGVDSVEFELEPAKYSPLKGC